jgi:outer membrane protein TolC
MIYKSTGGFGDYLRNHHRKKSPKMTGKWIKVVYFSVASMLLSVSQVTAQGTLSSGPPQAPISTVPEQMIDRVQSPFAGSASQVQPSSQSLDLTLSDALERGIRYNLGLSLSEKAEQQSRGARLQSLADILPHINGSVGDQVQKINLQALGIGGTSINGITIPKAVGPFSTNDATAAMTWKIFDLESVHGLEAANESVRASDLSYRDARETVVIVVCANYLVTIAAASRATSDRAQLDTAKSLLELAQDQEKAGIGTHIDTLRANVEVQSRQQQLTDAENQLAKQQIALARTIGLPVKQKFHIANQVPYKPLSKIDRETASQTALKDRPDYLSALAQLRAAELRKRAARDQYLPSLGFNGNYGVIGRNPASVSPQWTAAGSIQIPIFRGGKIEGELKEANAIVAQRSAMVENLRGQIEQEVENALLDLDTASKQVDTATAQLQLATETLSQARDRFSAGVTNNIEVIQAQESVATANDFYITSVYDYNIAKVSLARSVGSAEKSALQYLQVPGNAVPAPNFHP